ncbi:MAG: gliding motility-associated protein GldE [Bacteroidaceae bacterium]|nr:gliding motility-associated protein GldE [Bacteroidaceae bacterium]
MIPAFLQLFASALSEVSINAPSLSAMIALVIAALMLCFSAFASGSEIAFFSLSRAELDEAAADKSLSAQRIITMLKEPERLLATILIVNDFVNVGIVMLLNYFFMSILSFGDSVKWLEFLLLTVVLTFLLLLFGEVMPKIYSKNNVRRFAFFAANGLYLIYRIVAPFSKLLVRSTAFTERLASKNNYSLSVDELEQALELTDKKEIGEQKNMLEGIIRFGDETVRSIMTPRMDMVMLDIRAPYNEVLSCAADNAYSRIPVYAGTQDDIRGVLYIKDLLPYLNKGASFRWQSLIRQPYFVPETKKIDDLLCDFQTSRIHMALVIDEFGGVSGLITLEDIIEEIVGEINDEFDEPDSSYERVDENTIIFEGKTMLADFFKIMSLNNELFDDVAGEADTLAGLLLEVKGEFPRLHEKIVCEGVEFEVMSKDKHRLIKIKASLLPKASETEDADK